MALKVVITGASSGIGAAFARHYAGQGAVLGLVARRGRVLEELASGLGVPTVLGVADVRDAAALREFAGRFLAQHGVPDIVIANAGVSVGTLTHHAEDTEVFREVMDINVGGVVNAFQPFVAAMTAAGRGTLAGIASVAGIRGLPGAGAYSASKAALISYLESLRVELRPRGIRVVTILPGYIATPMTDDNPYPMPFILQADDAVRRMARVIDSGRSSAIVPWQMALVGRVLKWLPNGIYDRLFASAPHKPRRGA